MYVAYQKNLKNLEIAISDLFTLTDSDIYRECLENSIEADSNAKSLNGALEKIPGFMRVIRAMKDEIKKRV